MDNSSRILETISHNISGWNPIAAEVDLLGQTLKKSVDFINEAEDKKEDFVNIIQKV